MEQEEKTNRMRKNDPTYIRDRKTNELILLPKRKSKMSQKKIATEEIIIFDKVKWYEDENQDIIKKWLDFLLKSLLDNNLLSEEGKEIFLEFGIDNEFSLT